MVVRRLPFPLHDAALSRCPLAVDEKKAEGSPVQGRGNLPSCRLIRKDGNEPEAMNARNTFWPVLLCGFRVFCAFSEADSVRRKKLPLAAQNAQAETEVSSQRDEMNLSIEKEYHEKDFCCIGARRRIAVVVRDVGSALLSDGLFPCRH